MKRECGGYNFNNKDRHPGTHGGGGMNNLILTIAIFAISFLAVSGCSDGGGSENLTDEQKALIDIHS